MGKLLGSYCGAIIGSIDIILGSSITIEHANEKIKKDREFTLNQENENRRL